MSETVNLRIEEELENIDSAIKEQELKIKRGEALKRLKKTEDYKIVFEEGYLEAEAERLFGILTNPSMARKEVIDVTHDKLNSIRDFKEYVGTNTYPGIVLREAENAPATIEENKLYRDHIKNGGLEDE